MRLTFAQVSGFVAQWRALRLTDGDLRALESSLLERPEVGDLIPGTGGVRKFRFAPPSWHRGKRGSARVWYFVLTEGSVCYLLAVYAKNQKADLTAAQKQQVRDLTQLLKKAHAR